MKIAIFTLPLLTHGGGAEKYFINLARELRKRQISADVITLDTNSFKKFAFCLHVVTFQIITLIKYNIHFFDKVDLGERETEQSIRQALGKARWLKISFENLTSTLRQYDLIYAKNEIIDLGLLKLIGYKRLPPIIVGVHTPLYYQSPKKLFSKIHNLLYQGFFYRWLLKGIKYMHLSNRFTKNLADKKFRTRNFLIYYPFSVQEILNKANNYFSPLNFDQSKFNLAFIGRLSEQKGTDFLLDLIKKLNQETNLLKKICLNIFGSGDKTTEDKLVALSKKYLWLKYHRHIENKFIPAILMKQNLLLSPSKWETLPFNILEAQALGIPVIAFDIPGPNDIIKHKLTGYLVKNQEEFYQELFRFINHKSNINQESCQKNICEKFAPEKIYNELINMFKVILKK